MTAIGAIRSNRHPQVGGTDEKRIIACAWSARFNPFSDLVGEGNAGRRVQEYLAVALPRGRQALPINNSILNKEPLTIINCL
jgi:hypothetical protein